MPEYPGEAPDASSLALHTDANHSDGPNVKTNDARLTDMRVPTDGSVTDAKIAAGAAIAKRAKVVAETHADAGVASSSAEQTLASLAIPTDVAAGDILVFKASGNQLNNSGANVTYTARVKIGATTVLASAATSIAASATRRAWNLTVYIYVRNPASDQWVEAKLVQTSAITGLTSIQNNFEGADTCAEDLTAGKNAIFTVQLGTAVSTADVIVKAASLDIIKK